MKHTTEGQEAWGKAMGFWFRLWQAQFDQSLKFWCYWAQAVPRPTAAQLSAEADALRDPEAQTPAAAAPRRSRQGGGTSAPRTPSSSATVH